MKVEVEIKGLADDGKFDTKAELRPPRCGERFWHSELKKVVVANIDFAIDQIVLTPIPREFWVGEYPDGRIGPVTFATEEACKLGIVAGMNPLKARVVE